MKKIEAIIRTSKFYEVKDALHEVGIEFFTYADTKAVGSQKKEAVYRGQTYDLGSIARTKMEIIVSENLDKIVSTIMEVGRTGNIGDGRIYVYDVDKAFKIRTGETDEEALRNSVE